jgi:hypothetical protein
LKDLKKSRENYMLSFPKLYESAKIENIIAEIKGVADPFPYFISKKL